MLPILHTCSTCNVRMYISCSNFVENVYDIHILICSIVKYMYMQVEGDYVQWSSSIIPWGQI